MRIRYGKKQLFSHSFTFGDKAPALSPRQLFTEAMQLFRQGDLQQTRRLLENIIENNPNHTDAFNLMGGIESKSGHLDTAEQLISRAISIHANVPAYHNTASNWQVRQPVYRDSMQRWKNYETYLEPLRQALSAYSA